MYGIIRKKRRHYPFWTRSQLKFHILASDWFALCLTENAPIRLVDAVSQRNFLLVWTVAMQLLFDRQ